MKPVASVIVRSLNKERLIRATLISLRSQSLPVEIIVVDSGSTDRTLDVARSYADQIIEIEPSEFSYGGALNIGAAAASCDVHMALSAHCVPRHKDWVAVSLSLYSDPGVAANNQGERDPRGEALGATYFQSLLDARKYPYWGFSNHASSWRAAVWRHFPFREDLPACEDKEWSWRVLASGWTIAYDPRLSVPTNHRHDNGFRDLWYRHHREARAMAMLGAIERSERGAFLKRVLALPRSESSQYPHVVRLLNPFRLVEIHGDVVGSRATEDLLTPTHQSLTTAVKSDD